MAQVPTKLAADFFRGERCLALALKVVRGLAYCILRGLLGLLHHFLVSTNLAGVMHFPGHDARVLDRQAGVSS